MESLVIESTASTPAICFQPRTRELTITGESCPENAAGFYAPVLAWLDGFLGVVPREPIRMNLEINYFNSSSFAALRDLLTRLDACAQRGRKVTVIWRYHVENDMALEYGEEFQKELRAVEFHLASFSD